MKEILLINPPFNLIYGRMKGLVDCVPPLGLAYIGGVLETLGIPFDIIDMPAELITEEQLADIVKKTDPKVVGITATTPIIPIAKKIAGLVKLINPEIKIVIGGPHTMVFPKRTLNEVEAFDISVYGEGEFTFAELVECLDKNNSLHKVRGICFRENGGIVQTATRPFIKDLSVLPFPVHHKLPLKKYTYPIQRGTPFTNMITSRGCPGKCIFCSRILGDRIRFQKPELVVDEMEYLVAELGVKEIHIKDDTIIGTKRMTEICEEIKRRNLDFLWACSAGIRADFVTDKMLKAMNDAGCYLMAIGIESGSQKVLDNMKKNVTLEQNEKAVEKIKNAGMLVESFFSIGHLGETVEDVKKTIEFAKKLDPDFAKFSMITPFPGSELYTILDNENRLLTKDWEKYQTHQEPIFVHDVLSSEEIQNLYTKAYRSFYFRPIKILKYLATGISIGMTKKYLKSGLVVLNNVLSGYKYKK